MIHQIDILRIPWVISYSAIITITPCYVIFIWKIHRILLWKALLFQYSSLSKLWSDLWRNILRFISDFNTEWCFSKLVLLLLSLNLEYYSQIIPLSSIFSSNLSINSFILIQVLAKRVILSWLIGVVFMVTWRRRFLQTHLSQGARKLIWSYFFIHTIQEINSSDDPELDTLSSWKMLQFLGCMRSKQLLKLHCLEWNLLRWRLEWKHSGDCNKSCAWWDCQSWDRYWFMGTTCQLFTTHSGQSPHWINSQIQFVSILNRAA